ncbi:MAG TPA: MarC family protein [Ferrovibrio sp.]|jgi:multiple antibiotic resistance protein|uniref:MarC family protein n=1 Tax=Ferrovibrio sp. TaxID=1917215 RepID=UPI002B4B4B33|nr:MarC family protein [Ferrovibrio sp.]HLT79137.1 MarC family protein [Ferrovibrio sp.]
MLDIVEYVRFAATLFFILDPFAAIPLFLMLTNGRSRAYRAATARTAALAVFAGLVVASFSGDFILRLIGASLPAFQVGGSIVLLLMALSMLNARLSPQQQTPEEEAEATDRDAVGVVPIAMPLLVGPGAISATIIHMERGGTLLHKSVSVGVLALICLSVWLILKAAERIGRRLGQTGLNILNRIFGLLLAALAVQIFANGLKGLFPALG